MEKLFEKLEFHIKKKRFHTQVVALLLPLCIKGDVIIIYMILQIVG